MGAEIPGVGNKSISLKNCHNVLLRDFSILHGGHFGILATGIDNFTLDNLKIDTNRDGMDVDCCRNVRISNCYVNSPWDDGICLKADHALGSSKQTEFVTITNCYVSGCWEEGTMLDGTYKKFAPDVRGVSRTGRIKFGTESDGGFRNITISNCVFEGCQGLALETRGRGHPGRHYGDQHFHARHRQRAHFPAIGQAHAHSGRAADRHPEARHHQQHCLLRLDAETGIDHQRDSRPLYRRRQDQQCPGVARGRRNQRGCRLSASGVRGHVSRADHVRHARAGKRSRQRPRR